MPTYQFRCPDCAGVFDEKRTFARAGDPARCPGCGGERAGKIFASPMFYAPGSAATALLAPKAPGSAKVAPAAGEHASGCPCCSGRAPA